MDWVSMIVGGSLYIGGIATGLLMAMARRGRTTAQSTAECECGDSLAMHDPKTGECHGQQVFHGMHDKDGAYIGKQLVRFTCRQYVGPVPADRMLASFTMPIDNGGGDR